MQSAAAIVLVIVLLAGGGFPVSSTWAGESALVVTSPAPAAPDAGNLAGMLGRLPDLPLGKEGATVTYADIVAQAAALGVAPPRGIVDVKGRAAWVGVIQTLRAPESSGRHWALPEWREAFGFDVFQVGQAAENAAPPFSLTVLRGTFDAAEPRAAWRRAGYQPIDLGAGEAYAVRDDYEIDFTDPGSRMALSHLNVVAFANDGTLLCGSSRDGVRAALAATAGQGPSFAGRADVAPLIRAAPRGLVSALLFHGALLQALPDPAEAVLQDEAPAAFATRVAAEQREAQCLPPVIAALLGQTAGRFPADAGQQTSTATPGAPARLVVLLTMMGPDAAAEAAAVIAERLATQQPSARERGIGGPVLG